MKSVFEYVSYKPYLKDYIEQSPLRGELTRLSEAAGCQNSYLSKVLQTGSKVQLTHEHLDGISEYLSLSTNEFQFFKLILEVERASQIKYRKKIQKAITEAQEEFLKIKNHVGQKTIQTSENIDQTYYSHWIYSALHIAVSIPRLQTVEALSKHFYMPEAAILTFLQKLEALQLVEKKSPHKWIWKSGNIHLTNDSPLVGIHHSNWRSKAAQESLNASADSVHYSVVQSISQKDYEKLNFLILEWIKTFQKIASPSDCEELVNLNIDFYKLVRSV